MSGKHWAKHILVIILAQWSISSWCCLHAEGGAVWISKLRIFRFEGEADARISWSKSYGKKPTGPTLHTCKDEPAERASYCDRWIEFREFKAGKTLWDETCFGWWFEIHIRRGRQHRIKRLNIWLPCLFHTRLKIVVWILWWYRGSKRNRALYLNNALGFIRSFRVCFRF